MCTYSPDPNNINSWAYLTNGIVPAPKSNFHFQFASAFLPFDKWAYWFYFRIRLKRAFNLLSSINFNWVWRYCLINWLKAITNVLIASVMTKKMISWKIKWDFFEWYRFLNNNQTVIELDCVAWKESLELNVGGSLSVCYEMQTENWENREK